MIKGLRHIGINTCCLSESVKFYKMLGFTDCIYNVVDDSEYINRLSGLQNESLHMIKLRSEVGITIELVQYTNPVQVPFPIYGNGIGHIALEVDDINKVWKTLIESNAKVVSEPLLSSDKGAYVFFCYDPNGFRIEFVELVKK